REGEVRGIGRIHSGEGGIRGGTIVIEGDAKGSVGVRGNLVDTEIPVVELGDGGGCAGAGLKDGCNRYHGFEGIDLGLQVRIEVAVRDPNRLGRRDRIEKGHDHVRIVAQRDIDRFLQRQGSGLLIDAANVALADQTLGRNVGGERPLPGKDLRQRCDRVHVLEGRGPAVRHIYDRRRLRSDRRRVQGNLTADGGWRKRVFW